MTSLLKGSIGENADIDGDDCDGIAKVNEMIAEVPDFFTDRDALHELFREVSDDNVVRQVVKCLTRSIPWDEKLTRLASERCFDYDLYGRDNVTDNEITSIYKESRAHCKYHIPVGMLLSYPVRTAVTEWPDFLNKCRCHLSRDDAALDEAFTFAEHVLKVVDLTSELRSWLIDLIRRIKASFHYTRSYQTFRICIFASESSAPLACLKGTDETRIGLKRHVAEYLGTISSRIGMKRNKQDAWKLLFCILIMPMEFPADGFVPESLKKSTVQIPGEKTLSIANGVAKHFWRWTRTTMITATTSWRVSEMKMTTMRIMMMRITKMIRKKMMRMKTTWTTLTMKTSVYKRLWDGISFGCRLQIPQHSVFTHMFHC